MGLLSGVLSAVGSAIGGKSADRRNKRRMEQQHGYDLKMAQNSIQWRVQDAKKAGLHPLYALGAPAMSSTVSNAGSAVPDYGSAGESIGRALSNGYEKELRQKNLDNIQADIDLKRAQTADVINNAKIASNNARAVQTGRTAGNPNSLTVAGTEVTPSKSWSDTQDVEDRYGDIISWLYGVGVLGGDTIHNLSKGHKSDPKKYYENRFRHKPLRFGR